MQHDEQKAIHLCATEEPGAYLHTSFNSNLYDFRHSMTDETNHVISYYFSNYTLK